MIWKLVLVVKLILVACCSALHVKTQNFAMEMQVSIKSTDKLIHSATVLSDIACAHWCLDTPACCSASYEMTTKECLLDSCCNPETQPSENGIFIQKTSKSSREQECIESAGFIYNTTTDVCYHIGPEIAVNFTYINAFCPCIGSELIKIDSSKKQVFVEEISGSSSRLCIQGNNDNTDLQFRFDNGSQMNYFHWDIGQPEIKSDEHYLVLTKGPLPTCISGMMFQN